MSKSEMVVQVDLVSETGRRTAWVPPMRGLQVNAVITLKDSEDPKREWIVTRIGEARPRREIKTDWHNNI